MACPCCPSRTRARGWAWTLGTAAVLAVVALAGCGSGNSSKEAQTAASKGCTQFLQLGGSLANAPKSQSFPGSSIDKQFTAAQIQLDRAAKLDKSKWGPTDQAARQFIADLRAGKTPDSTLVVAMTNGCEGFAAPSATSRPGSATSD